MKAKGARRDFLKALATWDASPSIYSRIALMKVMYKMNEHAMKKRAYPL
jgi:hypothetical protein